MHSNTKFKELLLDISSDLEIRAKFLENPVKVLHKYEINMGEKAELEMAIFIEMTVQNLEDLYTRMEELPDSVEALQNYYDKIKRPPGRRMVT